MRRAFALPFGILSLALTAAALLAAPATGAPLIGGTNMLYLPFVAQPPPPTATPLPTETPTPSVTPTPTNTREPGALEWDPRLDQRGVKITPAVPTPGKGYWRLVKGVWYAEDEPPVAGQHHIFVDALDVLGARKPGVRFDVTSPDGTQWIGSMVTELKPGELYAANFPMWAGGKYGVTPTDGHAADAVSNLSMGSIEHPDWPIHTSYGFVWQWTEPATATPTATATPPLTLTPTPTETVVSEGVRP